MNTESDTHQSTHIEEISAPPQIIKLGKVKVDVERITARDSCRMWDIIMRAQTGEATDEEIIPVILDIVKKQNQEMSRDDLLDEGNIQEVAAFIASITKATLRTFTPILQRHPELFRVTPADAK